MQPKSTHEDIKSNSGTLCKTSGLAQYNGSVRGKKGDLMVTYNGWFLFGLWFKGGSNRCKRVLRKFEYEFC